MTALRRFCACLIAMAGIGGLGGQAQAMPVAGAGALPAVLSPEWGATLEPVAHRRRSRGRRVRSAAPPVVIVRPFQPVGVVPPVVPRHETYPAYGYPYRTGR